MQKDNILWFDIESTGLELYAAKIITISFIFNGQERTIIVNPGIDIPEGASRIHGIKNKDVKDLPSLEIYSKAIFDLCCKAEWYAGHNLRSYDMNLLKIEMLRYGYEIPNKPIIDTYEMSQSLFRSLKLVDIYRTLTGKNFKSHQSADDIAATKELYEVMKNKYYN